tara:strand:+ start:115 stop:894 length:780 start_codon:yes stop_codon:yes gene_type:complete
MKFIILILIIFLNINNVFAQEESFDDFLDSDDDFGLDFEDEEFSLDGEELFDDEFSDDEFSDDEFSDDEFSDDFSIDESFSSSESITLEDNFEGDTRSGYSLLVSGGIPVFRNNTLIDWNGSPSGRISIDLPNYFTIGPIGFRIGAEFVNYGFSYDETGLNINDQNRDQLPLKGKLNGIGFFGVTTFTSGPGNLRFGVGLLNTSPAYTFAQSIGFAIGRVLDVRIGIRGTVAYSIPKEIPTVGTHISWVDSFIATGITF